MHPRASSMTAVNRVKSDYTYPSTSLLRGEYMTLWIVEDEPDYLADAQQAAISAGFAKEDIFYTSSFEWPPKEEFKNLARGNVQYWEKEMPQIVVMDLYDQKSGQFSFESFYHGLRYYERTGL